MQGFMIVVFIILILFLYIIQNFEHENKINRKIESIGGRVISIESRNLFSGIGPFMVVGKGRTVYRIEYQVGDEEREGWVRFGGILGPDWRL